MCAITEFIDRTPLRPSDRVRLEHMTRCIAHRGPDAEAFYLNGFAALGHRRLKIIDLASGQQPLFYEDGPVVVLLNGENYDFLKFKTELEAKGHVFDTHCDTEIIVHAFEEYGTECPKKVHGMFPFAVYDSKAKQVFMARGRVSKKPLYYPEEDGRSLFFPDVMSLLKGIRRQARLQPRPD